MTDKNKGDANPFPPMPGDPVEVPEPRDPDEAVVVETPAPETEEGSPGKRARK